MIKTSNESILYWQGRSRNHLELSEFHQVLRNHGFKKGVMPIEYDIGPPPNEPDSKIYKWIHYQSTSHCSSWWIGISLGASIAYVLASSAKKDLLPRRITLINPFSNRIQLAREKGFSLNQQWPLMPINFPLQVPYVDIILSKNDDKIPNVHGQSLIPMILAERICLVFIDADHTISDRKTQAEIANFLLNDCEKEKTLAQYSKIISCKLC